MFIRCFMILDYPYILNNKSEYIAGCNPIEILVIVADNTASTEERENCSELDLS